MGYTNDPHAPGLWKHELLNCESYLRFREFKKGLNLLVI
jgi:hypothetical protein